MEEWGLFVKLKGGPGPAVTEKIDKIFQNIDFLFFAERHSLTSVLSGHTDQTVEKTT